METQAHDPGIRPQPKLSARINARLRAAPRCSAEPDGHGCWRDGQAGLAGRVGGAARGTQPSDNERLTARAKDQPSAFPDRRAPIAA